MRFFLTSEQTSSNRHSGACPVKCPGFFCIFEHGASHKACLVSPKFSGIIKDSDMFVDRNLLKMHFERKEGTAGDCTASRRQSGAHPWPTMKSFGVRVSSKSALNIVDGDKIDNPVTRSSENHGKRRRKMLRFQEANQCPLLLTAVCLLESAIFRAFGKWQAHKKPPLLRAM